MKKIILILAMGVFSFGTAQNKNVNETEETTTTKATIETKDGERTIKRNTKIKAKKEIKLQNADEKKVNYKMKNQPFQVEVETSYNMGNDSYNFTPDDRGFTVSKENQNSRKMMPYAKARRTTTNDGYYIMTSNNNKVSAYGYFDENGDFIAERYDPKTDRVIQEKYTRDNRR